ncbi:MAG: DUF2795 domain-containing protein [Dehalococcoidia bacterium]
MTEYPKLPSAEPADYEHALEGIAFPAAKDGIVRHAADIGGLDSEVGDILHRLPREGYETREELIAGIRAIYLADGFPPDSLPV